ASAGQGLAADGFESAGWLRGVGTGRGEQLFGPGGGPEDGGVVAKLGGRDLERLRVGREYKAARGRLDFFDEDIGDGFHQSAAEDDAIGGDQVNHTAEDAADVLGRVSNNPLDRVVARLDGLGDGAAADFREVGAGDFPQ